MKYMNRGWAYYGPFYLDLPAYFTPQKGHSPSLPACGRRCWRSTKRFFPLYEAWWLNLKILRYHWPEVQAALDKELRIA